MVSQLRLFNPLASARGRGNDAARAIYIGQIASAKRFDIAGLSVPISRRSLHKWSLDARKEGLLEWTGELEEHDSKMYRGYELTDEGQRHIQIGILTLHHWLTEYYHQEAFVSRKPAEERAREALTDDLEYVRTLPQLETEPWDGTPERAKRVVDALAEWDGN